MAEELQESEVVFREDFDSYDDDPGVFSVDSGSRESRNNKCKRKKKKKKISNSVPVDIPENVAGKPWFQYADSDFFVDDEEEMVPPHVMVGRRVAGKTAFSVCTGNGRTLKGRDLSQVRNSILRMTGFLET